MLPLALPVSTAVTCAVPGFAPFFWFVPFFWLIPIVLLIAFVGRRWRRGWDRSGPGWGQARNAESLLAERFARGDIDEAEYLARLDVLRAG
jgi:putative membrane protein